MAKLHRALKSEWPDQASLFRFSIFEDFRGFPEKLDVFMKILKPCEFNPGATIIEEGTIGTEMFLLLKGQVCVYEKTPSGDEFKVADLFDHMNIFFGEGALLDVDSRTATIRAESQCLCYSLSREDFEDFSRSHPEMALPVFRRIARVVMARLRKANQDFFLIYNALVSEIRGR